MKESRNWIVPAQATNDGSGDVIVDLPAALLKEMGLAIGDDLKITIAGDTIILTPIRDLACGSPKVPELERAQADASYRSRMKVLLNIPEDATAQHIHEMIDAGFKASVIKALSDLGLLSFETQDAIVPAQTLKAKLASGERLSTRESDHLFRLVHTITLAESFFGDTDKALRWLSKPKSRFLGKSPIEMLSTTIGARQIEELLAQATEGMSL
ncbi:antitoxin Xre/MbcA/ParS toxin-binding domain-containing protein [Pseudomonas sp. P2758]